MQYKWLDSFIPRIVKTKISASQTEHTVTTTLFNNKTHPILTFTTKQDYQIFESLECLVRTARPVTRPLSSHVQKNLSVALFEDRLLLFLQSFGVETKYLMLCKGRLINLYKSDTIYGFQVSKYKNGISEVTQVIFYNRANQTFSYRQLRSKLISVMPPDMESTSVHMQQIDLSFFSNLVAALKYFFQDYWFLLKFLETYVWPFKKLEIAAYQKFIFSPPYRQLGRNKAFRLNVVQAAN